MNYNFTDVDNFERNEIVVRLAIVSRKCLDK